MAISVKSDFTGDIDLSQNQGVDGVLNGVITRVEKIVLTKLMGAKLYNEAVADNMTNGTPSEQRFIALLEGTTYLDCSGRTQNYDGLREMLLKFIWARYKEVNSNTDTGSGTSIPQQENGIVPNTVYTSNIAKIKHDEAVNKFNEAFNFIATKNNQGTTYFTDIADWTYERIHFRSRLITVNVI